MTLLANGNAWNDADDFGDEPTEPEFAADRFVEPADLANLVEDLLETC